MCTCEYIIKCLIHKLSPPIVTTNIHLFWVKLFKGLGNSSAVLGNIASHHERKQSETEIAACRVSYV
jgi:uncharacterized membrane protein (DUF4010 family)